MKERDETFVPLHFCKTLTVSLAEKQDNVCHIAAIAVTRGIDL
jgi:hypothetical protein